MTPPDPDDSQDPTAGPNGASDKEVSLTRIQLLNLVFIAVGAGLALVFSRAMAFGVLLGGALMAVNLRIIVGVMSSVIGRGSGKAIHVGLYWAKFTGLLLLIGVLLAIFKVDPVGLLIGLSIFLVAIGVESTTRLLKS